ncbi:MAG: single-stranded DNA-binding protein [Snowella sp.]|nr:single-stranded DNA-binding protein [Snowella sp.]
MNLNSVHLVGYVGRDPEVKYFESGKVVCTLTLAVNRIRKDDPPDWFELQIWDKTAEFTANYVRKGRLIGVQGSLKIDTWNDRATGANRSKPIIRVDKLELLGSKRDNEASMGYSSSEF